MVLLQITNCTAVHHSYFSRTTEMTTSTKAERRKKFFMGHGPSTQAYSWVVITEDGELHAQNEVPYVELSKKQIGVKYPDLHDGGYGTEGDHAYTDARMLLDALDLIMQQAQVALGTDVTAQIAAHAVSAQQHGVWLGSEGIEQALRSLDSRYLLSEQLSPHLRERTTHWMDKSAARHCKFIEQKVGAKKMLQVTGSRATTRFMLAQLMKIGSIELLSYEHIGLLHQLITNALAGRLTPLGRGDALGTNLVKLDGEQWWMEAFTSCGMDTQRRKLPDIAPSSAHVGTLASYFKKYGFPSTAEVYVGDGDNCDSIMDGDVVCDLGSSFTLMRRTEQPVIDPSGVGHVFGATFGGYITLYMPPYGGLHLNNVCGQNAGNCWSEFDSRLSDRVAQAPPKSPQILVPSPDGFAGNRTGDCFLLATVEGLLADMVRRCNLDGVQTISVNGGAASDPVCQILADMTGCRVEQSSVQDGPALGAAIRAAVAYSSMVDVASEQKDYTFYTSKLRTTKKAFDPHPAWNEYYNSRYMPAFQKTAQPVASLV